MCKNSVCALALMASFIAGSSAVLAADSAADAPAGQAATVQPPRAPTLEERVADLEALSNSQAPAATARLSRVDINTGDNAWLLASAALVLMMTGPGLALFYGGLVRRKNTLSTMMHSLFLMALVSILWMVYGYSMVFGEYANSTLGLFIGNPMQYFMLDGVGAAPNPTYAATIPHTTFMLYQMMFAVITPALISGAYAERIKFSSMVIFTMLWSTLVYFPLAHMVWGNGGLFSYTGGGKIPVLDFAGGTVVHISSGFSALVCAVVFGKRHGYPHTPMPPHNLVLTCTGAALLWFGWFGFNAGSALCAGALASSAFAATHFAAAAGCLSWTALEWILKGKPSALGAVSGMVAGLATVTQASGFVSIKAAVLIGLAAGMVCFVMVMKVKSWLGYDDALDAFGVHGIGGLTGALLTGLLANAAINSSIKKVDDAGRVVMNLEGGGQQFLNQAAAAGVAIVLSVAGTFVILKIVKALTGLRPAKETELEGLDLTQHGEEAYATY